MTFVMFYCRICVWCSIAKGLERREYDIRRPSCTDAGAESIELTGGGNARTEQGSTITDIGR